MNVDIPQLLTHAVGFLIFVWILRKFAWGPLLALMEERRNKIAGEFEKIEQDKAEVADLTAEYQNKLREIDNERRAKLVEAVEEGKELAAKIKTDAWDDVRKMQDKAKSDLDREVDMARVQLRDDMVAMTVKAAQRLIGTELDDAKHRELIGNFIDNLEKA